MTKDNWIKELREIGICGCTRVCYGHEETYKKLETLISQVEKDAYQLGLRDGIKKEHENSGAWTDLNKQGVINTHKLIKDAKSESYTNGFRDGFDAGVDKTNKRWRECFEFTPDGHIWVNEKKLSDLLDQCPS